MKQVTINHYIQRDIMKALLATPVASYSTLKPAGIESNLFLYHLQQLIRAGLVEKTDKTYRLSILGKQFLDRTNLDTMVMGVQPKVITIQIVRNPSGEYLLLERLHQPFIGMQGFPSGKLHFGETLQEGAYRELEEKVGLTAKDVELRQRGNIIMRFFSPSDQTIVNHVIAYVFAGAVETVPPTIQTSVLFKSFWGDVAAIEPGLTIKGHPEILGLLEKGDYFVESFDFESSY